MNDAQRVVAEPVPAAFMAGAYLSGRPFSQYLIDDAVDRCSVHVSEGCESSPGASSEYSDNGGKYKSEEYLSGIEYPVRVKRPLDCFHDAEVRLLERDREIRLLRVSDAVLAGDRPAE